MASQDIFGRDISKGGFGGAFSSAGATMQVGLLSDLLVTNVQVNYQQQVNRIFDVQSDKTYYVVGRVQGNGSLGTVVGPKGAGDAAISELGDPCNKNSILFNFTGSRCGESGGSETLNRKRKVFDVVLQSVGFTVQAQDMVINENLGFQFGYMTSG